MEPNYIPRVDRNHVPKPKRYYMIRPQLSTSVKPDTYGERFHFPRQGLLDILWRDKTEVQRDALGLAFILFGIAGLYLILNALGIG